MTEAAKKVKLVNKGKVKVILQENVKHLGRHGDIVEVKPGYARNFLLARKLALRATKANIEFYNSNKDEILKNNEKKLKEANSLISQVGGSVAVMIRQAAEDGRLFGSVSAKDIAESLSKNGVVVDRLSLVLEKPIKFIGVHVIEFHPHSDVSCMVYVNVARTTDEAEEAFKKYTKATAPVSDIAQE